MIRKSPIFLCVLTFTFTLFAFSGRSSEPISDGVHILDSHNDQGLTDYTKALSAPNPNLYSDYFTAAQTGDPNAQYALGDYYYLGHQFVDNEQSLKIKDYYSYNVEKKQRRYYGLGLIPELSKDYCEAVKWYELAAAQSHLGALWTLGECYELGRGVEQSFELALARYHESAEKGYAAAQHSVGILYDRGWGVDKDSFKAVEWYKKAAKQGWVRAQCGFAQCYYYGRGIKQNKKKAGEWYRKAAKQDYPWAQYEIAESCLKRKVIGQESYKKAEKQYRKALKRYKNVGSKDASAIQYIKQNNKETSEKYTKAEEQEIMEVAYALRMTYAYGQVIKRNNKEAVRWYKKAAEQGYLKAQYKLGKMYAYSYAYGRVVKSNKEKASKWYKKAAEQGHKEAQYELAKHYISASSYSLYKKSVFEWYKKAAEQGHKEAQYELAKCYTIGQGIKKDRKEAISWYKKAAEQGLKEAQYELAEQYIKVSGKGLIEEKDEKSAFEWYKKAAEQGLAEAQRKLAECYTQGKLISRNFTEAFRWNHKAAKQGDRDAQYTSAVWFTIGMGVAHSAQQALRWYRKAAAKGFIKCQYYVSLAEIFGQRSHTANQLQLWRQAFETENWRYSYPPEFYDSRCALKEGLHREEPHAQYLYGELYFMGFGRKQDFGEATKYLQQAANQNHYRAARELIGIYELGLGVVTDFFEAFKWQVKSLQPFNHALTQIQIETSLDLSVLKSMVDKFRSAGWEYRPLEDALQSYHFKRLEDVKIPTPDPLKLPPQRKTLFKEIKDHYDLFLFDIGGVIYDGQTIFPYAWKVINALAAEEGKKVILVSNAARPHFKVREDLNNKCPEHPKVKEKITLDERISIISAGDIVRQDLQNLYNKKKIYHFSLFKNENKDILREMTVNLVSTPEEADVVLLTQFIEKCEEDFQAYDSYLERVAQCAKTRGDYKILCVNPDIEAFHGPTKIRYCAGAFAKRLREKYEVLEKQIIYYGKPDPKIYDYIPKVVPINPESFRARTVMIGDTLYNDILGAKEYGIDPVLVLTGNTAREIKEQKEGKKDIWSFLVDYYKEKQAMPRYFINSLTDEYSPP